MAIISTLRDKMGKFLVVVVGFSIAAFVLGDILGPNSSIGSQNNNIIHKLALHIKLLLISYKASN